MHLAKQLKKSAQWAQSLKTVSTRGFGRLKVLFHNFLIFFLAILISVLSSCATKESTAAPQPKNGITEYREITTQALRAVQAALDSLNLVAAQTSPCPPKAIEAFGLELQRLYVDSIQVRERAQAIQARGDAYFENWSENLARMKDPKVRERAARFHSQLLESFLKLKFASQEARGAFHDFFAGLRQLRTSLEKDPGSIQTETTKNLVHATQDHGRQVLQHLTAVSAELDAMTQMLTPNHQL
jgi:hypothetical protein